MKYLKKYNESISSDELNTIYQLEELFYDLSDNGFKVSVPLANTKVDWRLQNMLPRRYDDDTGIKYIDSVSIFKIECDSGFNVTITKSNSRKWFNDKWSDIKDVVLFAERYAKKELGLEINYIFTSQSRYYRCIDDVDNFDLIGRLIIAFRRIEQ